MNARSLPVAPERLVFVGGLHRSGTTPLTRILGTHPEASVFSGTGVKEDEGQHLQTVYPSARAYGGAGRFAFDQRSHLTEGSALCTAESAHGLLEQWTPHWDLGRRLLVEKSPPNLVMTRFLRGLFPESHLVMCVRHPVVVALSTVKWSGPLGRVSTLLEHWLVAHETFLADSTYVQPVQVVRYEQLTAQPRATLDALGEGLGLSSPLAVDQVDPARSRQYVETWADWRSARAPWSRWRMTRLRDRFADRVAAFGYDFDDLSALTPFPVAGSADV